MSRPASVTSAIVGLSLFALAAFYWLVVMFTHGTTAQISLYMVLLAAIAAPIYGLFARKGWARIYTVVIFSFFAVLVFVGNIGIGIKSNKLALMLVYCSVIAGLIIWNIVSLLSNDVKKYFLS